MRRIGPSGCLLALGLCLAPAAWADEPGQDEVTLKGGGSIRGTVLVSEPDKSVKIQVMGEPEPRVVPWSDVEHVEKGKYALSATAGPAQAVMPPAPSAPPPPPPGPQLGAPGVVRVHLDSPAPVTLIHEYVTTYPVTESRVDRYGYIVSRDALGVGTRRDSLCVSPCDQVIGAWPLRIVGQGFPSSSTFDFAHDTGDVTVHVQPGSNAEHYGGIAAIILGGMATIAGAVVLPLNQSLSTTTDTNTGAKVNIPNPALRDAGIGLVAGGLVAVGAGIALVVTGRTKLTFTHESASGEAKPRYWLGEF